MRSSVEWRDGEPVLCLFVRGSGPTPPETDPAKLRALVIAGLDRGRADRRRADRYVARELQRRYGVRDGDRVQRRSSARPRRSSRARAARRTARARSPGRPRLPEPDLAVPAQTCPAAWPTCNNAPVAGRRRGRCSGVDRPAALQEHRERVAAVLAQLDLAGRVERAEGLAGARRSLWPTCTTCGRLGHRACVRCGRCLAASGPGSRTAAVWHGIESTRQDRRYCFDACRQAAYRERRAA